MRIYRSLAEVPADFGPAALTIGNFDGVHFGHRRILRRLREVSAARGWKASALTFDPHPLRVVAPGRAPRLMTSPEQRARLMGEEGVEQVLILPFTPEVAILSPEEFVRGILVERLGARAVLVGDNFRFGHGHRGNVRVLAELGRGLGLETEIVPVTACRGRIVSSSRIRDLIERGCMAQVARFLERPYTMEGEVVRGRGVGSKQTVPTLNLAAAAEVVPARGVYITRTRDLDRRREWNSVTNIGYRPTFGESAELTIETFLLDPLEDPTPRRIAVAFLECIREERRFESPEALKAQILKDVGVALRYFRRVKAWTRRPGRSAGPDA
jgi:riboflavin kinase / FMN adenylyltransferase